MVIASTLEALKQVASSFTASEKDGNSFPSRKTFGSSDLHNSRKIQVQSDQSGNKNSNNYNNTDNGQLKNSNAASSALTTAGADIQSRINTIIANMASRSSNSDRSNLRVCPIIILPGDGIGPEVIEQAVRVLDFIDLHFGSKRKVTLELWSGLVGGAAIDATGVPLPEETLTRCHSATAVLLGAVGGPKWSDPSLRPEKGLLDLRKELSVFANIRPCYFASQSLIDNSPLKSAIVKGTNIIMVRELLGGAYFGDRKELVASSWQDGFAYDTMHYTVDQVRKVTRVAAYIALTLPKPIIHCIDKANVLASSRLWRQVVTKTLQDEFPSVPFDFGYVDAAAMHLIQNPTRFNGVLLTENLFGDILSDEASVIPGSLGLLPSASLSGWHDASTHKASVDDGTSTNDNTNDGSKSSSYNTGPGLYEPIHGSAPDIAGQGTANPIGTILSAALMLRYSLQWEAEAALVEAAVRHVLDSSNLGGLGLRTRDLNGSASTADIGDAVVEYMQHTLDPQQSRRTTRPLTLCEKILKHHAVGLSSPYDDIKAGDMICVNVDWTLASELTWKGMEKTYDIMGRPGVFRNDRFWLAIDHTVDPRINDQPKPRNLIATSESFAKEVHLVDFHGPNQTILHTDFYRERAQPGMLVIGADSHSCSAGGLGTFAVGLGAADVVMPLVTGQTWFQVPEVVEIRFINEPPFGIGGKDVILYVLGKLKRNTVAFERAVEYTGPGLQYLSCDARFAIANMTTEFGGIAGVFEADEITAAYIAKRSDERYRQSPLYFRADKDAEYVETHIIDLSKVESCVALFPSPDKVVSVGDVAGKALDGCFIGACTTGEEDLILAGLVLEAGLNAGLTPIAREHGKRKVTPGSVGIVASLRQLGLIDVYKRAGFEIGAPGCSFCLGIAADVAGEGEVWLSSQNRNFENRMGKGSIANLASAATVAASAFKMEVTDPSWLLAQIDQRRYKKLMRYWRDIAPQDITISEPRPRLAKVGTQPTNVNNAKANDSLTDTPSESFNILTGRCQVFGDHIDTDAIIPAQFMPGTSDQDLGTHAFEYVRPEFRERVTQGGRDIVIAGEGFGSGSSREEAPRALKGVGVKAVIAKSFAFIYARNQPNMALLGIVMKDENFYAAVKEDTELTIDVPNRVIHVPATKAAFPFQLSDMEEALLNGGGVTELYKRFGNQLFQQAIDAKRPAAAAKGKKGGCGCSGETTKSSLEQMAW